MPLPPDLHVHTEWSYDGRRGSMERSCERAIELGLPAVAFTDHADFVKVHEDQYCVDIAGYLDSVERCRTKFPGLRILSGVELGEPHWFPAETAAVLSVNTTRGDRLCPDMTVVRWWRELGGQAVQYGSDAHSPDKIAAGFHVATQMVEAAGFKPARDPVSLWRR